MGGVNSSGGVSATATNTVRHNSISEASTASSWQAISAGSSKVPTLAFCAIKGAQDGKPVKIHERKVVSMSLSSDSSQKELDEAINKSNVTLPEGVKEALSMTDVSKSANECLSILSEGELSEENSSLLTVACLMAVFKSLGGGASSEVLEGSVNQQASEQRESLGKYLDETSKSDTLSEFNDSSEAEVNASPRKNRLIDRLRDGLNKLHLLYSAEQKNHSQRVARSQKVVGENYTAVRDKAKDAINAFISVISEPIKEENVSNKSRANVIAFLNLVSSLVSSLRPLVPRGNSSPAHGMGSTGDGENNVDTPK